MGNGIEVRASLRSEPVETVAALKACCGRFVVQRLDARRLHYDFRLELNGVLKSWAVTHGPSLDPADRRLAVRMEDFRFAEKDFETAIQRSAYDAATVLLWDSGHWRTVGDPDEGMARGLLKLDLDGVRLKGGFTLMRLGKRPRDRQEHWLLIKERDAHAERAGARPLGPNGSGAIEPVGRRGKRHRGRDA